VYLPLPRRAIEVVASLSDFARQVDEMVPVDSALTVPIPYRRLARAVTILAPATYCRIALRRVDYGLALRATAGHRLPVPTQRRVTLDELAVCRHAMQTRRPVELWPGESLWLNDDQWPILFGPTASAGMIVPFSFGASGEGVLLLGEERAESRRPPGMTDRLDLLGRRVGQILDLAHKVRTGRQVDRGRQRQQILAQRRRDRRQIAAAERRRLARDLHDDVGHTLNQAIVHLRGLRRRGDASADGLQVAEAMTRDALDATRRLAYGIRMRAAKDDPLADARLYAGNILSLSGSSLNWIEDRADRGLPLVLAQELGHVIRESVTNAVKYSDATNVTVHLSDAESLLSVTISDDGRGFVPMSVTVDPSGRGLGLLGNRERVAELGGTLSIVSAPVGGTRVRAEVPLPVKSPLKEATRR
jgi:signal transduction histidine kinase